MRRRALLFALSLYAAAGCAGSHELQFSGRVPPSAENQALCRAVCERAACKAGALAACLSDCKRPRNDFLPCEYPWSRELSCQRHAADLACDEGGGVYGPSCREESRRYVHCMLVE